MNFDKLISIAAMVADAKSVANLTATDGSTEVDMYPSSSNIAPGTVWAMGSTFCHNLNKRPSVDYGKVMKQNSRQSKKATYSIPPAPKPYV